MTGLPPRMAAEMQRAKAQGALAISVWTTEVEAMASRADAAESTTGQLDELFHGLMYVVIHQNAALAALVPDKALEMRAEAEAIFKRWAAVQQQIEAKEHCNV